MSTTDKKVIVIFHKNCWDGTGAAWAAWKKFGDTAEYVPFTYSDPVESLIEVTGKEVYVVDFSFKKDVLQGLRAQAESLVVIDHHATAQDDLAGEPDCVFDMTKSGAVLAWEYFHPDKQVPFILSLVQDRDLWKYNYQETMGFHAWLMTNPNSMDVLESIEDGRVRMDEAVSKGLAVVAFKEQAVRVMLQTSSMVTIEGKTVCIAMCIPTIASEMGSALAQRSPDGIGISYSITRYGDVALSIRGDNSKDVDTTPLARAFGGGGHKMASGGKTDMPTLMSWIQNRHPD